MKRYILILFSIIITLYSCSKENYVNDNLVGKWNWVSSSGGIVGVSYTPASTGTTKCVVFTSDYVFKYYKNDTLVSESKYHIIKSKSFFSADSTWVIEYELNDIKQSFSFDKPDFLILMDECIDCFENKYERAGI